MTRSDCRQFKVVVAALAAALVTGTVARADELPVDRLRIQRALERERTALAWPAPVPVTLDVAAPVRLERGRQAAPNPTSDSVWEGLLIGAGIGGVSGYVWARQLCGTDDDECFYIAAPAGIITGTGIGALVGAIVDKLHK
jgi:hypothetical protein